MTTSALKWVSAAALACCTLIARADNVVFNASGTLNDGTVLGGTLTINTATGNIAASDITATVASDTVTFNNVTYENNDYGPGYALIFDSDAAGTEELNYVIYQSLVGFSGGDANANVYFQTTSTYGAQGSLDLSLPAAPTSATPEPASMMLLGTGLLGGLLLAGRRRRVA